MIAVVIGVLAVWGIVIVLVGALWLNDRRQAAAMRKWIADEQKRQKERYGI